MPAHQEHGQHPICQAEALDPQLLQFHQIAPGVLFETKPCAAVALILVILMPEFETASKQ